jgi:hypothetical protein
MTSLEMRIERLERLMHAGQIDQIELTCWSKARHPMPTFRELSQTSRAEADIFLISSDGERLEEDTDSQIAMALFLTALKRTGARGSVTYSPGMKVELAPGGVFPADMPDSWSRWPALWSGLQRWIATGNSTHGAMDAHQRDADRSSRAP